MHSKKHLLRVSTLMKQYLNACEEEEIPKVQVFQ